MLVVNLVRAITSTIGLVLIWSRTQQLKPVQVFLMEPMTSPWGMHFPALGMLVRVSTRYQLFFSHIIYRQEEIVQLDISQIGLYATWPNCHWDSLLPQPVILWTSMYALTSYCLIFMQQLGSSVTGILGGHAALVLWATLTLNLHPLRWTPWTERW